MIYTNLPNKAERCRLTFSRQIAKPLLVILFFIAGIHFNLLSQVFPVSSVTSVTPPYPTSLDGFADQSSSKIILQLVVNDVTLVNYPVKLRLVMKSNNVRISTSGSYITQPFYLNGGEALVLNAADLSQYFHTDNLDFSGYSKSQYLRTGLLPDGIYQISFEVLDYNRNTVISSSIPAFSYLFVNDPPILNTPKKSKTIEINGQQNIIFNWAFRHSPFSRPGFQPEYQLEMWEIYPDNLDPNMVVRSSQPVFSEKITSTSFQYTNMHPLLIPGRRYAWRVTAADPLNMAPFKENGCSEVWWFRYGVACDAPVLKAGKPGTSFLNVEWETPQLQTDFTVRYKPEQNEDAKWYNLQTSYLSHKIENLRANTSYIVEVSGNCGLQESPVSNQITLRTNVDLEYQCGNSSNMPKIENQDPLMLLQRGNFIKAGDFEIEVYQVEGANGVFNGKGYVLVPMFNFIKLDAELKNVRVNTDFQLIGGSIRTIYNVNNSAMVNISKLLEALSSSTKPEVNHFAEMEDVKVINAADAITSVTVNGQTVTVKTADKTYSETINPEKIVAITAPSGEQYVVDGSSKTVYTSAGSNNGTAPKADQLNYVSGDQQAYRVSFTTHPQQAYGFDVPPATPPGSYNSKIIGGNTVYLPWKSVASGGFDKVTATITGPKIDSVFFATESASMIMAAPGLANGEKQLMFTGGGHKDDDELFAWFNTYTGDTVKKQENVLAGAMNVIAYDKKLLKVCLVPVNGSVVPDAGYVQTELNRIYKQAVVSWEVSTLEGGLTVNLPHENQKKIDNTDADTRMDYTEEMKLVKKAMLDNSAYNSQTLYLFFFDEGTKDIKGYMPFNRQFGFIIKFNQYPDEYLHTIAHELGHGAFRLQHPYEHNDSRMTTEDDLMAYSKSERLKKTQWDECHDWDLGLNWFEGEEEGEDKKKIENYVEINCTFENGSGMDKQGFEYIFIKSLSDETKKSICFISASDDYEGNSLAYRFENAFNYSLYDHYLDTRGNVEYDIVVLYSRSYVLLISKDENLKNTINTWLNNDEVKYSFTKTMPSNERNSNQCLISEIFIKIGEYYSSNLFLKAFKNKSCFITYKKVEEVKEELVVEDPEISAVRTYIDLDGNVKIIWKSKGGDPQFYYKINDLWESIKSERENDDYIAIIQADRKTVTEYQIKVLGKDKKVEMSSSTGDFQGNDNNTLCKVFGPIGKEGDESKYSYLWNDSEGQIPIEFGEKYVKPFFNFQYSSKKIYKLTRTHKNENIIDEALVLIDPKDDCNFSITITDFTPYPENMPRTVKDNKTYLEVVLDDKFEIEANFIKTTNNPYGSGYPLWYLNLVNESEKNTFSKKEKYFANIDKVGEYILKAEAYDIKKEVKVRAYMKDEKGIDLQKIQDPKLLKFSSIEDICKKVNEINEMLNEVDEKLEPLRDLGVEIPELKMPVYCTGPISAITEYWAEVYGKPNVVRDISGTITNGIQTKEFSIPLGEAGSIGLEFAFDPIIIEYDARKRMEKESIIQLKGGSGRGKITLCLGPSKLITTQVCGDIDLYARLQKSTIPGCDYEYVFGFGSSNFYTKTKVAGVETTTLIFKIEGSETSPNCLIYK